LENFWGSFSRAIVGENGAKLGWNRISEASVWPNLEEKALKNRTEEQAKPLQPANIAERPKLAPIARSDKSFVIASMKGKIF
jgi:hypothetical protein